MFDPNLRFDHVNGYLVFLKSIISQSLRASLKLFTMQTLLSFPHIFSFKFKTSLKSPKHNHSKEDKEVNLLKKVQVCFFWSIPMAIYSRTSLGNSYSHFVLLNLHDVY